MKYRILGTLIIIAILAVICFFGKSLVFPNSNDDSNQQTTTTTAPANNGNDSFKF